MRQYYYLEGKEQKGPFTLAEIKTKNLTSKTLIWHDGLENWLPLIDIPDLKNDFKTPPLPPVGDIVNNNIHNNSNTSIFKPTKKELTWLICWSSFHFFALILSNVKFFNYNLGRTFFGTPKESFWPFVKFIQPEYEQLPGGQSFEYYQEMFALKRFNGLFYQYDWTEFVLYFGSGIITYILIKVFKNM